MNIENLKSEVKIKFITKLLTWALITEPLIYFVFSSGDTSGINLTLGRLLQMFVIFYLILILISNKFYTNPKYTITKYNNYILKY